MSSIKCRIKSFQSNTGILTGELPVDRRIDSQMGHIVKRTTHHGYGNEGGSIMKLWILSEGIGRWMLRSIRTHPNRLHMGVKILEE